MKTLLAFAVASVISVTAADTDISPAEIAIGVSKAEQIGVWKVRSGLLREEARATFEAEKPHARFAYATQTVREGWTLGIRRVNETEQRKEPGMNGKEIDVTKPAVVYLQGPSRAAGEVELQIWSGKIWQTYSVAAQKDGTVKLPRHIRLPETGKLFIKWRGANLTFDLTDYGKVTAAVQSFHAPKAEQSKAVQPPPR